MFKQLRNKFLILNLVTISVMMLMAFTAIYLMTYNNVRRDIDMELRKISEPIHRPNEIPKQGPPLERSLSFTLTTDSSGDITSSFSIFDMDKEFYEAAKEEALSQNKDTGNFKMEGYYWTFMKRPSPEGYRIVFLDITSRQAILTNLIYTFLIAALAMIIVIFFISRSFANRSIKPIKEAFDKQKQFIADASHELKTPLAVINTNVDVLLSNGEDNINSQSKWLYYIKSEVERMSKLTNDLLYLARLDRSDAKMLFSVIDMSETVQDVILTMEAVIYENNIALNYEIEPGLKTYGNSEQIKQVVMILLDNALKYTDSKGNIDVNLKQNNNSVVLSVANTGEGIPDEYVDKIFDRFYRIDKSRSRKSGGYGLGLSIARAIVEQHEGRIWAKSILNEKTTFSVELPRVR